MMEIVREQTMMWTALRLQLNPMHFPGHRSGRGQLFFPEIPTPQSRPSVCLPWDKVVWVYSDEAPHVLK